MPVLEQVLEQYPQLVKISFKQFPLRSHKFAFKAAQATVAAHRQNKFWEFHDLVFKNYRGLNDRKIDEIRDQLITDKAAFQKDMLDPQTRSLIEADIRDGRKAGVRGTPTVFINGIQQRDLSIKGFQRAVKDALKKSATAN